MTQEETAKMWKEFGVGTNKTISVKVGQGELIPMGQVLSAIEKFKETGINILDAALNIEMCEDFGENSVDEVSIQGTRPKTPEEFKKDVEKAKFRTSELEKYEKNQYLKLKEKYEN